MAELSSPAAVLEIGTAAPWVRKSSSAWVRGPVWDGFWMLSALWLAPIVLLLVRGYSNPESSPLDLFYFGLTALFWIGHRLSSTYLAYCTEAGRWLEAAARQCQILWCASLNGLYHFVVALWRVNSAEAISFYVRPFRPALNGNRAGSDFSPLPG
jgi:hypothetical protein